VGIWSKGMILSEGARGSRVGFLQCPNNLDSLFGLGGKHDE
jgi:hypothetical protein